MHTDPPFDHPRQPSEYEPSQMANATLVIAAHVTSFPEVTPEHFGALVADARLAIDAVRWQIDVYRREVAERLADGRMSEGEYTALYERVAGERLVHDERLARLGVVAA